MNYRWTFRQQTDEKDIHNIEKSLKFPKSLSTVLVSRGIKSFEDAEIFFKPKLDTLHDPFLMDGMDKAVRRTLDAVDAGEKMWVHGDYDVDGTSSTALVCQFINEIGGNINYYIPDRFDDGYGLSKKSVDLAKDFGASLLITVDVGITSFEPLEYAKSIGLDIIICDHHEPGDHLPDVHAILDPIKPGCQYPFKHLAACGVAFKFIQALSITLNMPEKAYEFLDYVALASAADMVPLVGENRTLVHFGLELLNKTPRAGLKGLIYCTGLRLGSITASNIVFAIAPLINAAGRLGDARRSVEMMLQKDENAAFRIAQQLEDENRKRRLFDQYTFDSSVPMAEDLIKNFDMRCLVIHGPDWHPGVIGIVASRLVDKFNLPTVLLTNIDGIAKGSARSINEFDIHTALKDCEDLLIEFGGHKHAAGLSLKSENVPEFRRRFNAIAATHISTEMLTPEILIDSELQLNELSPKFLDTLSRFAPYGFANYKPIFLTRNVTSVNGVKIIGNNNIRFRAFQNNFVIDAIGINLAKKVRIITSGKPFSMVFNLESNNFTGQLSPQLTVKDIRPADQ